jgi:crossover junction endodeoxyribonuclease RuvC
MSARAVVRVLGVDTSLRSTGAAVVERVGSRLRAVAHETIRIPAARPHSHCLRTLHQRLHDLILRTGPAAMAVEGVFHCRNVRTAVILGEARGVVIAVGALHDLPVFEYAPRRVKLAVCGSGAASKDQVARMVAGILGLPAAPAEDEADALALAICHCHGYTSIAALQPKQL